MRFSRILIVLLCPWISGHILLSQTPDLWKVSSYSIKANGNTAIGDHLLTAHITNTRDHANFTAKSLTFMTSIQKSVVINGKVILLGKNLSFDEAIIIGQVSHAVISRAVGYSMRILDNRWLVSVEWYPNHVFPPMYPNDVVLITDLANPDFKCASATSESDGFHALVQAAGRPIFPRTNLDKCSYDNVRENNNHVYRVYPRTFVLLPRDRIAFVASDGPDDAAQRQYLVTAEFTEGIRGMVSLHQQSLAAVAASVGGVVGEPLKIEKLEPSGSDQIRFIFKQGSYHIGKFTMHLQ